MALNWITRILILTLLLCVCHHGWNELFNLKSHLHCGSSKPSHLIVKRSIRTLKYLGCRIQYYTNSTATFQISLTIYGDIEPNPGPHPLSSKNDQHRQRRPHPCSSNGNEGSHDDSELYRNRRAAYYPQRDGQIFRPSSRLVSQSFTLDYDVWKHIHELGISRKRKTHRGSKGRGRGRLSQNLRSELAPSIIDTNQQPIPSLIRERKLIRDNKRHIDKTNLKPVTLLKANDLLYYIPRMLLSNVRSVNNKIDEIAVIANENKVDLIALTETWTDENTSPDFLSINGFVLFSKSRTERRGGGVALYVNDCFNPRILPVIIPNEIEAIWVIIRPKLLPREISCIIVCVMYFPPRYQFQNEYIEHITSTIDYVLQQHPDAGILIAGDMNDLDIRNVLNIDGFDQVVNLPTRENNILDKIITNCVKFYSPVELMSPIGRSDHNCVLLYPLPSISRPKRKIRRRVVRPLPDSGLRLFGQWITTNPWSEILQLSDPSDKCSLFCDSLMSKLNAYLPSKEVEFDNNDKEWMTPQLKTMFKQREKAFQRKDKPLWRRLRNKISRMIMYNKKHFYNTRVSHLKTTNPGAWYRQIKIITKRNLDSPVIRVPAIADDDPKQCEKIADAINTQFLSITNDLLPLDRSKLPAYLPSPSTCPEVQQFEVFTMLKKVKSNKAGLKEDLPPRIIREFACELSQPVADILNASFYKGIVPWQWKRSQIVPVPKSQPPSIEQLRPIALTSRLAKIAESFMAKWLLEDLSKYIDPHQYGNRPGISTSHYLIKLLHNIFENCERPKSMSTIVCTDFSKAFDRLDHTILIRKLIDFNVRPVLINWIISFLEQREQCVKYQNVLSKYEITHAGVPQGTKLGPILFLVMFNDACQDQSLPYFKYVDDLTLLENRSLQKRSVLQNVLDQLFEWTESNHMKLNPKKCTAMRTTFMKNPPIPELLSIGDSQLFYVQSVKILGVYIQQDLKWDTHINEILKKCNRKLYMFRMVKQYKLPISDLIQIYVGYIRPVLEYCAPVFNGGLTVGQILGLERIQKRVCKIILGKNYINYEDALEKCQLEKLQKRREKLCTKFAESLINNPQFQDWIPKRKLFQMSLRNQHKYNQFKCKTSRFKQSAIPYFIDLLNNN